MKQLSILLFASLSMAGATLTAVPARADIEYPWCVVNGWGPNGCMYSTLEQCQAFINGGGGICSKNPRYMAELGADKRGQRR